jgi:hypothetical protein
MDAGRNYDHYVDGHSTKIDEALGNTAWRDRWKPIGVRRSDFRQFLATEFSMSMESLGYLKQPLNPMKLVRSDEKTCHFTTLCCSLGIRLPINSGTTYSSTAPTKLAFGSKFNKASARNRAAGAG